MHMRCRHSSQDAVSSCGSGMRISCFSRSVLPSSHIASLLQSPIELSLCHFSRECAKECLILVLHEGQSLSLPVAAGGVDGEAQLHDPETSMDPMRIWRPMAPFSKAATDISTEPHDFSTAVPGGAANRLCTITSLFLSGETNELAWLSLFSSENCIFFSLPGHHHHHRL